MLLQIALLLSMLIQLGAAITAVSLIRRTRFNISWILISSGFVLMALRRLFEFSALFWETQLISKEEINSWVGVLISILMLTGVTFIRQIFNLQDRIDEIRKESEARLLKAVIQTEEKARQSFARELHDGLGPVLSSIKMIVSAIELDKMVASNKRIIERTCKATDEAIITLKEISNHLSPHLLKNYGLTKALNTFASQLLINSDIQLNLSDNFGSKRYSYDLEINVFRVVSELLNNSVRHGSPSKIKINIKESGDYLRIEYEDNGSGFNFKDSTNEIHLSGMGLENIRSRIKSLNGFYYMESEPGEGVKVHIQIPVK
ncbi:sensor histidine kinase [Maribellus maritimus]|uniref:sensor histidine kinase n=1 Tax=Maribellus maritimus TaxID=2870838 RepID=UPI001EEA6C84|nr:ATP-binding protein [Maribellus maritimus]MCG6190465.1 sensor histidine kinase [Maribellus maritimus]